MNTIAIDQPRRILSSWKEVAAYLGTGVRTAQRYEEKLAFPIRRPYSRNRSSVIALVDEVDLWLRSARKTPGVEPQIAEPSQPRTLRSWKEIANYVNRGVRTVQRYRRDLGFPVYNHSGNSRGHVLAFTQEIDVWLRSTSKAACISKPQ